MVPIIKCSVRRTAALLTAALFLLSGCEIRREPASRGGETEEAASSAVCVQEAAQEAERSAEALPAETPPAEEPAPEADTGEEAGGAHHVVVIDPGHQEKANLTQEPIGPGAAETKYRVSGGTVGCSTGLAEYELNLQVALRLRDALEAQGCTVILTRETNAVDLSNIERSRIANEAEADAFVRIHANGAEDAEVNGILTVCMTPDNPYNGALYADSRRLSAEIAAAVAEATGAKNCGVWETDTMSGINWSEVPVTILEMGYMSNQAEDERLASPEYQDKIVQGIAAGLAQYFADAPDAGTVPGPDEGAPALLQVRLQTELDRLDSKWDVWAETLHDGTAVHCTRNLADGETLVSASLVKLFIMGAVYDRIEHGDWTEDEVKNDLTAMITVSDNAAANRLTRLLGNGDADSGRQAVNDWAASVGCGDIRLNRLMLANNGLENYVSAASCAALLRSIYRGECVSEDCSARMLALLKAQQVNDRIPVGLPAGTVCAHKTGNLSGLCVGDVGIVFSPAGDYILCVICNDPITDSGATQEIAALSQLVYACLNDPGA